MNGGVIAAGHPVTAAAGREVLEGGGNAVDAGIAAMMASLTCEPLLTALGAGGYMLVVVPGQEPVMLDFFVAAPGRGTGPGRRAELLPVTISFGDAVQVFNIGVASVGAYGVPAGLAHASQRFGRIPLAELAGPAARLAREGVELTAPQAYLFSILGEIVLSTPECAALFATGDLIPGVGARIAQPELAAAIERLGDEGAAPFYTGEIAGAVAEWVLERGGRLGRQDLAAYRVIERRPVSAGYRGRAVLSNPPPSAGGTLIAHALARLEQTPGRPDLPAVVDAMEHMQALRTPDFLEGLASPGAPLGSTTHIAVLDAQGHACSVTCSNGSSSGVVVPGTGMHLNNMLGEQDLNPLGFHRHPPGRRLPSMMSPTVVMRDGRPEIVLGSAGSNRIRSAILQTIIRIVDDGLRAGPAVQAPRVHFEDGILYAEPDLDLTPLEATGRTVARFRERNLFFGGVSAVQRDAEGHFSGGGDPRRGGAALLAAG